MKKNKCLICDFETNTIKYSLPTFDHFRYKAISKNIIFKKCLKCSLIFNHRKIQNNFFYEKKYVQSNIGHILYKKKNKVITRELIFSKIIKSIFKQKTNLKILDIGCSNGILMKMLDKKLHNAKFFGIELSNHTKKIFPYKKNFILLIKPSLDRLTEKSYDLIILSHVFNYLNNPKKTLKQLYRLLKAKGKLFIVLPNLKKNPYYSLMGDQKLILTPNSSINILNISGFSAKIINNHYLSRQLIIVATNKKLKKFNLKKDNLFEKNINIIKEKKIKIFKQKIEKPIIFGTNINSACIDELTGSKTLSFVDENLNKNIKNFRNKEIIHPKKLREDNQVILSVHNNSQLKEKLKKKYSGKFLSI